MPNTTFDPALKNARITLSGGDLTAVSDGVGAWARVGATPLKSSGKWYYEVTISTGGGHPGVGIGNASQSTVDRIGIDANGYEYDGPSGEKLTGGVNTAYGATFTTGDIISILLDKDAGEITFWKNGVSQGLAYSGLTGNWAPSFEAYGAASTAVLNTGVSAFAYTPPVGYSYDFAAPTPGNGDSDMQPMTAVGQRLAAAAVTMQPMTSAGGFNGFGACVMQPMAVSAGGGGKSAALVMAAMTADATGHSEHRAAVTMEPMTATGTGYASSVDIIAVTVPKPTMSATILTGRVLTVSAAAPVPVLVATLSSPIIITAAVTAPRPRLSAQILTGNVATLLATAATPIMAAAGYPAYIITFAGTAPAPRLNATLSAAVTAAFRTWVLNTRTSALTEYDNFSFNSFAVFNGKVLACGSAGVVELGTQALDNATAIAATVTSGADNFGDSRIKRVPRIYIDYTTTGDAQFSLTTTEGGTRTYSLAWNNVTGSQQRRIPVGKGPKSSRWQWSYANVAGSDFGLNAILAYPTATRRRVQ